MKNLFLVIAAAAAILFPAVSYSGSNMDVVLVMDSSGSMKKTDPLSLRIPAAKLFISLLEESDRAGVMSFSDAGYPVRYLTPVSGEENRKKLFRAAEKISTRGAYTNLYEAMKKGMEMLSADTQAERPKIMILMSDGMMDVGDPAKDGMLTGKVKNALTDRLKDENIRVYTIAFTEGSDRELLRHVAKRTGGFFNLALTDSEFHSIFTSIFESLKAPEMLPVVSNGFLVDGSVEEVTIVATKDSPDTRIQINAPDGSGFTSRDERTGVKWFVSNKFDMITVKDPAEGRWEILFSTGEGNKAYIITNLKLQTNFEQLYTSFGKPLDFSIWLEKDGARITEQEVLDKIDLYIELTSPDKETSGIRPFDGGGGLFTRRIAPFSAGNYKMRIVAKGKTFQREKTFVFYVAGVEETKEEIEALRREKGQAAAEPHEEQYKEPYKEPRAEKQEAVPEPEPEFGAEEEKTEAADEQSEISWKRLLIWFLVINLLLGLIVLVYKKRYMLISLLKLDGVDINGLIGKVRINALLGSIMKRKGAGPEGQDAEEAHAVTEKEEKSEKEEDAEPVQEQGQQAAEEVTPAEEAGQAGEEEGKKVESSIKIGKEDAERQAKEKLAEMVQNTPEDQDDSAEILNAAPGEEVKTEDQPDPQQAEAEAEQQGEDRPAEEQPAEQEPVETQEGDGVREKNMEINLNQEQVDKEVEEKMEDINKEAAEGQNAGEQEQAESQDEGPEEEQTASEESEDVPSAAEADVSGEEELKTEAREETPVEEGPGMQEETGPAREEAVSEEPGQAAEGSAEEDGPGTDGEIVQAPAQAGEDADRGLAEGLKEPEEEEISAKEEPAVDEAEQAAMAAEQGPEQQEAETQGEKSVEEEASKLFEEALKEEEENTEPENEVSEEERKVELHEQEPGSDLAGEDINKLFEEAVKGQDQAEQGEQAAPPVEESGGHSGEELKEEDGGSAPG